MFVNNFDFICGIEKSLERFKGIHPGAILGRELKKRTIKSSLFARLINTHRQILNDILKEKRGFPIPLALQVDKVLGVEERTFAILQTYYDIKKAQEQINEPNPNTPNLNKIRKVLFGDTNINKIDWQ